MIPLARPYFELNDLEEVRKVMISGWASRGPKCQELEGLICDYTGAKYVVTVSNCTAALYLSLMAFDFPKGSEVIVPDFTFPATALAVMMAGLKPVFVDVLPNTYNIDPDKIIDKLNEKDDIVAIIPVHLFGQMANMDRIYRIGMNYGGIKVIEDAACSLGAYSIINGNNLKFSAGSSGDVGCFSFHARKGLTTGEGGCIVTDDKTIASRVRELSNFGIPDAHDRVGIPSFDQFGFNFKMSDIQAAIGVAQMKRLDRMIAERRMIAGQWKELIKKYKWVDLPDGMKEIDIQTPYEDPNGFHVYQSYVCKTNERDWIIDYFGKNGMETGIGTYSCSQQPVFAEFVKGQKFPVSEELFKTTLSLPMFINLRVKENQIIEKL